MSTTGREEERVESLSSIRAELSGQEPRETSARTQKSSRQKKQAPVKKKQPTAGHLVSAVAADWFTRARSVGMDLPYDENYLALAIQARIDRDPDFRDRDPGQTKRWLLKMSERWWEEYVDNTITAKRAKETFLETDWDDLKDYARSCLRAAYLRKHGVAKASPEYPRQQEYQDELTRMRVRQRAEELEAHDDLPEHRVDEGRSERLRSWRARRSK